MLRRFLIAISLTTLLLGQQVLTNVLAQQPAPADPLGELGRDAAETAADELLFENLASLAGPSCNLYGLGLDLVNFAFDGQWSFLFSVLDITVLFRNEPWRELIWAIEDQRTAYLEELTSLRKRRCLLGFATPELLARGTAGDERRQERQLAEIDEQIVALQAKLQYFAERRWEMLFDRPRFADASAFDPNTPIFPALQTDKIFYFLLVDSIEMDWQQFLREGSQFLRRTRGDLAVVLENIPDTCFAVVNIPHELGLYFAYAFELEGDSYKDSQGNEFASFADFVRQNEAALVRQYNDLCRQQQAGQLANPEELSAEEQYRRFLAHLEQVLDIAGKRLTQIERELLALERIRETADEFSAEQQQRLQDLQTAKGQYLGMIDYHSLVMRNVGSPTSQSLTQIGESLSRLVEAVLGVVTDDKKRQKSRLSFSERFQDSKERSLRKICARITDMYRKAGRSTADLPVIGSANGRTYCKAASDCADVNLSNLVGGSEGRKKLAECSGFLFDSSELGLSQATEDVLEATSEDLSVVLQQRSLNDLLKARNLHFASLRNRYKGLYETQGSSTALLETMLTHVNNDLYNPEEPIHDPEGQADKTHFGLMRKVYQDFWQFMEQQEGSCAAPQVPEL